MVRTLGWLGGAPVALTLLALPAQAADLRAQPVYKAPPPIVGYDWTGLYVGGNVGYGVGQHQNNSGTSTLAAGVSSERFNMAPDGLIGGGQIGYNYQWQKWVIGLEADFQGADMKGTACVLTCGGSGVSTVVTQELPWFATARGRIGFAYGPTLSYITGGYAYGKVNSSVTTTAGAGTSIDNFNSNRSGYTLGSGIETAIGGNWTAKLEYIYLDLGTLDRPTTQGSFHSDMRDHMFRVGLNYRFGGTGQGVDVASAAIPARVASASWAGVTAGINFGYGLGRGDTTLTTNAPAAAASFKIQPDGYLAGGQIGYNWQAGNFVAGIETDLQGSTIRNFSCVTACGTTANANSVEQSMPWFGTTRGRIGYAVGPALYYATGGVAYGQVKNQVIAGSPTGTFAGTFDHTKVGYAVGGGIETAVSPFLGLSFDNWTVRTEYLYVDLGTVTDSYAAGAMASTVSSKSQTNIFRTAINYKFF